MEKQWTVIREEAIALLKTNPELFSPENPELTWFGNWSSYYFYRGWSWDDVNCMRSRKTCKLLREFRETSNSSKSEVFSILEIFNYLFNEKERFFFPSPLTNISSLPTFLLHILTKTTMIYVQ